MNISKDTLEEELRNADSELDSAVEKGMREQELYWLGRKEAIKSLLDDLQ